MAITKNTSRQWPLVATVDIAAADISAIGTYPAIDLPGGAKVISGEFEVITPNDTTATHAVHIDAEVLLAAADYAAAARTAFTETGTMTTAPNTVDIVVAVATTDAGTYRLTVTYFLDGRSNEVQPVAA